MKITNPCGRAHFQNVRCRECDAVRAKVSSSEEGGKRGDALRGGVVTSKGVVDGLPEKHDAGVAPGPLTPAEKQRAYRERLKADPVKWEAYKAKERERKRK